MVKECKNAMFERFKEDSIYEFIGIQLDKLQQFSINSWIKGQY